MAKNPTKNPLSENLKTLMELRKVGYNALARETSITPTTIKRIAYTEDSNPTLESLTSLAKYFAITVSELIGELPFDPKRLSSNREEIDFVTYIPKFSWEEMNDLTTVDYNRFKSIATQKKVSKKAFAVEIQAQEGDFFNKEGIIILDPEIIGTHGDFIIVTKKNEMPSIKKLLIDGGNAYLKPIFPGLNLIAMTEEYHIIGVIIEYKIDLKNT